MRRRCGCSLVAIVVLLGGCAAGRRITVVTKRPRTPAPPVSLPADQVVLRVYTNGGLMPAESLYGVVASLTVYGDGRVIMPEEDRDAQAAFGRPVRMRHGRLSAEHLADLVQRFQSSGLFSGKEVSFGDPRVTDMPVTTVTFHGTGQPAEASVYAFARDFDDRVGRVERARRQQLSSLIERVRQDAGKTVPYVPERLAVIELGDDPSGVDRPLAEWPGPDLEHIFSPDHRNDTRPACAVVGGPPVAPILAATDRAAPLSRWRWHGVIRVLVIRPLLPGEGCER